jgi:HSP20 family molecular chaperone IbpA
MWSEALAVLERAERLQRQFFAPPHLGSGAQRGLPQWEPPVDIVETEDAVVVHVALPGVSADTVTLAADAGGITVSALRAFPCREQAAHIHRVEIPYGRFERRIDLPLADPYAPLELAAKVLEDGVLTLVFRRREGA